MSEPVSARRENTLQLRTYQLTPETVNAFLEWWTHDLLPVRRAYGFEVPVAFLVPETTQFLWVVSHPGDQTAFTQAEEHYNAWPERVAVMSSIPVKPVSTTAAFILGLPEVGAP